VAAVGDRERGEGGLEIEMKGREERRQTEIFYIIFWSFLIIF
jgi:hypothetical protein